MGVFRALLRQGGGSGTDSRKRHGLQQMLQDCRDGKIDLILTKSVSRFARNLTDTLSIVRELRALGIEVWFDQEKLSSLAPTSEFMLTIRASIAEFESNSISQNVTWGMQKRLNEGSLRYSKAPHGYDLVGGNFLINEDTERNIRWIFEQTLAGKSSISIAAELNDRGIPTGTLKRNGRPNTWTSSMDQRQRQHGRVGPHMEVQLW